MSGQMTIGEFSRATRISAKALRFYHRNGILTPATVDAHNGYRVYAPDQIRDAQIVRSLRRLELPIDAIRGVLAAPDVTTRASVLAEHLARMEDRLTAVTAAVTDLRGMLEPTDQPVEITHRSVPETPVVAVRAHLELADLSGWFRRAIGALHRAVDAAEPGTLGAYGGVWSNELFEEESGEAIVYVEIIGSIADALPDDGLETAVLPAVEVAVARHVGADEAVPHVYAELGRYVARHELGVDGPVRETYVEGFPGIDRHTVTDIGWPIFRVAR